MALLAVDIGGSGSRALLQDGRLYAASGDPLQIVDDEIDISDALDGLASRLPEIEGEFDVVSVGLASLVAFGDPTELAQQVRRRWRCRRLLLASDAVMAVGAAWGVEGGAVVAAGTGVVGFATDFAEHWHRVDGWGHQLGDAGGGAWIGARGLRAALRSVDGRSGGSRILLAKAEASLGKHSGFAAEIAAAPRSARALASFVPAVAEAASEGDAVADGILSAAARELVSTAAAAVVGARRPRVALIGGLTAIESLVVRFEEELMSLIPGAEVISGASEPVHGALALAEAVASEDVALSHPPYLYLDNPA